LFFVRLLRTNCNNNKFLLAVFVFSEIIKTITLIIFLLIKQTRQQKFFIAWGRFVKSTQLASGESLSLSLSHSLTLCCFFCVVFADAERRFIAISFAAFFFVGMLISCPYWSPLFASRPQRPVVRLTEPKEMENSF